MPQHNLKIMAKQNLKVIHDGMGWPVGAVIPAAALAKDGADHVALGAVKRTSDPVTHAFEPPAALAAAESPDDGPLRAQVRDLQGKLAGAEDRAQKAEAEVERLKGENEKLWDHLAKATDAADARAAAARQAELDAGARGQSDR